MPPCFVLRLVSLANDKNGIICVRHRGRTASCPNRPRTDRGVPFFSTGLFENTRFRIGIPKKKSSPERRVAVASSEVGIAYSGPSSPDNVSFASYVLPSAPSPCDRRDRLRVLWADLTPYEPSAALLSVELAYLVWRLNAAFPRLGSGLPPCLGFPVRG